MNKQQLAAKIWESANKLRSKIEANEYKDYILGFIFYKYLSDREVKFLRENDFSQEDIEGLDESDPETMNSGITSVISLLIKICFPLGSKWSGTLISPTSGMRFPPSVV